jgi:hypothetical protein
MRHFDVSLFRCRHYFDYFFHAIAIDIITAFLPLFFLMLFSSAYDAARQARETKRRRAQAHAAAKRAPALTRVMIFVR